MDDMRNLKFYVGRFQITFHYWTWGKSKGNYIHVPILGFGFGKNGGLIQVLFTSLGIVLHPRDKHETRDN